MLRSLVTIDLAAVRHNVRALRRLLARAELWVVVKADGYGHGAADVGRAALEAGATVLCTATVAEAVVLRTALPGRADRRPRPHGSRRRLRRHETPGSSSPVSDREIPEGVPVHVKLDTGMGRWGLAELTAPGSTVAGVMSHFASADSDPAFTELQLDRFLSATAPFAHLTRHIANSAGTLRHPAAHLDAVRCGIAVYGISPFGTDPAVDGLRPALSLGVLGRTREVAPSR